MAEARGAGWQVVTREILALGDADANRSIVLREAVLGHMRGQLTDQNQSSATTWFAKGNFGEAHFTTDKTRVLVGRSNSIDFVLADPTVSRRHAMLVYDDIAWWIVDLKSTNGVWSGTRRIASERVSLGRSFRLGDVSLKLVRA